MLLLFWPPSGPPLIFSSASYMTQVLEVLKGFSPACVCVCVCVNISTHKRLSIGEGRVVLHFKKHWLCNKTMSLVSISFLILTVSQKRKKMMNYRNVVTDTPKMNTEISEECFNLIWNVHFAVTYFHCFVITTKYLKRNGHKTKYLLINLN